MTEVETIRKDIIDTIEKMGFPSVFGELVCNELRTEKQLSRMRSYLWKSGTSSMEEIADEMICIKEEFEKYRQRKISEHANQRCNEIINNGLE